MLRRNRRDLVSRDFHCPCGKAYLSYPALHTHIKKYHEDPQTMLEKATVPLKEKGKRGRPVHCKNTPPTSEFQELTFIETSILKIYQSLSKQITESILLEGNEEQDPQMVHQQYHTKLRSQAANQLELLTVQQLKEYEQMLSSMVLKLTRHFTTQISIRLKVMLVVGYIQHTIQGSPREECLAKISAFGWGQQQKLIAQILFDVMMRALQRHNRDHYLLTSNES